MFTCGLERSNFSFDISLSPCLSYGLIPVSTFKFEKKRHRLESLCHSYSAILQPPGPSQSPLLQYSSAPDRSARSAWLRLRGPASPTVSQSCIQTFLKAARR